jgi:hypothetical protein
MSKGLWYLVPLYYLRRDAGCVDVIIVSFENAM